MGAVKIPENLDDSFLAAFDTPEKNSSPMEVNSEKPRSPAPDFGFIEAPEEVTLRKLEAEMAVSKKDLEAKEKALQDTVLDTVAFIGNGEAEEDFLPAMAPGDDIVNIMSPL